MGGRIINWYYLMRIAKFTEERTEKPISTDEADAFP